MVVEPLANISERLTVRGRRDKCRECGDNRKREKCERKRESEKGLRDRNVYYL